MLECIIMKRKMNFFDEKVMREKKNDMAGGLLMVEINISLLKD